MRQIARIGLAALGFGAAHAPHADAETAAGPQSAGDADTFVARLVRVDRSQDLRGLDVPADSAATLARGDIPAAVQQLEALARDGSNAANVALVRTQHWCAFLGGKHAPLDKKEAAINQSLAPERAARTLDILHAQQTFTTRAAAACRKAPFDYRAIEQRMRAAASDGDAVSESELALFTRDAAQRTAYLEQAAAHGYAPAQHKLAVSRVIAVQRGETTENVKSIRMLLKQAGQSLPAAKVDLANCMATGCDGHPSDTATAAAFAIDAARDGDPSAYTAMLRMPWRSQMTAAEIAAWQMFAQRLNEHACMGTAYVDAAVSLANTLAQFEKALPPQELARAQALTERYWTEFSARARNEQRCSD
jgi:hypothetical protein